MSVRWKFLQFAPGKGWSCARTAVGVALQHTQLSSALHCWMGAVGCVPAGQLSAQPVRDGAGSKPRDTDRTWWGVPTRHPLLGYCNRKNRQKKPENKQLNHTTKYPNSQNQNPEQTQVSLPMIWAGSKQTITQTIQLASGPAEAEQFCYPVQQHCHCLTPAEPHIQLPTFPPSAPASLYCLSPWAQRTDGTTLGYLYTGFKRLTQQTLMDCKVRGFL